MYDSSHVLKLTQSYQDDQAIGRPHRTASIRHYLFNLRSSQQLLPRPKLTQQWTLLLAFPHLIVPPAPSEPGEPNSSEAPKFMLIPFWMDISLHLLPALALAFDFFVLEKKKYRAPASTWGAAALAGLTAVAYGAWVEYCAGFNGRCGF